MRKDVFVGPTNTSHGSWNRPLAQKLWDTLVGMAISDNRLSSRTSSSGNQARQPKEPVPCKFSSIGSPTNLNFGSDQSWR